MLNAFGFEVGSNGDALTTTNTGGTTVAISGGTGIISTAHPAHGTRGAKFDATGSGTCYVDYAIGSATAIAFRAYVYITALPSVDSWIVNLLNSGSQRFSVELTTTGALRVRDDAQAAKWTTGGVNTSTSTLSLNTLYRVEGYVTANATTGTFRVAVYAGDGTTPLTNLDTGTMTSQNTGDAYTNIRIGVKTATSAATGTLYVDDFAYDTSATGFVGPYISTLSTPVVTLGTATTTTTPGGSDGTQSVSWPAVSGATSYEAWRASGSSPAQGDFTLIATGVTSPYTFTGLSAGNYSYGIKAKG